MTKQHIVPNNEHLMNRHKGPHSPILVCDQGSEQRLKSILTKFRSQLFGAKSQSKFVSDRNLLYRLVKKGHHFKYLKINTY